MERPYKTHASDESLGRYAMGTLAEAESTILETHLLVCHECQDRLAQTETYVRAMQTAASRVRREPARAAWGGWRKPTLSLAFAVAFVLLMAVLVRPKGNTPAVAVMLQAQRGPVAAEAHAPAGKPLILRMDLTELEAMPSYRAALVDESGNGVWKGTAYARDNRAEASLSRRLSKGRYYVRLYSAGGELLREFGLETD
jgi:hypothetical protein